MSGPNAAVWSASRDHWVHLPPPETEEHLTSRPRRWRLWLLIVASSVVTAVVAFAINVSSSVLAHLIHAPDTWSQFQINLVRIFGQTFIAVAAYGVPALLTANSGRKLFQYVGGSGIPEIKCELSGLHLAGIFNPRVLLAKAMGLSLACGADLPVGKEGPFVHCAGGVFQWLLRFQLFQPLAPSRALRQVGLTSMVSVGVACCFSAPIGGVLFALEVTDSFSSGAYLHCFVSATIAALVSSSLKTLIPKGSTMDFAALFVPNWEPRFPSSAPALTGLFLCTLLGIVCGLLGAVFTWLHRLAVGTVSRLVAQQPSGGTEQPSPSDDTRSFHSPRSAASFSPQQADIASSISVQLMSEMFKTPSGPLESAAEIAVADSEPPGTRATMWFSPVILQRATLGLMVALAGMTNALLDTTMPFVRARSQARLLNGLISIDALDFGLGMGPIASLSLLSSIKFFTTILILAMPLPIGSVVPTFVLGAFLGRLFGRVVQPFCNLPGCESEHVAEIWVATFAIIGACAFCAGCVRSFAQIIIVFERTGFTSLLLPLCASSLAAIFVANNFVPSLFDSIIMLKRLPHLPSLAHGRQAMTVADVMSTNFPVLPVQVSSEDLEAVRMANVDWQYAVPIVANPEGCMPSSLWKIEKERLVLLSAIRSFPPLMHKEGAINLLENATVPLQVPPHTTLKALLPLLSLLEKNEAFVTQDGCLVGIVTLTDLCTHASRR